MNERLLCPSMMCANYGHLADEVRALDDAGVDIFHCDIMDGTFVPNFTMGVMDVQTIRRYTDKLVDCHLMIENPGNKVDWFIKAGANIIYIHPESERYVVKTLAHIKEMGAYAGIAVNPDTSVASISEILNLCDYVMVMTVNPGFAGQAFIDFTRKKIKQLVDLKEEYGFKIMIDGHCTPQVIEELSKLGADGFILGTSAIFGKNRPYKEIVKELRGERV
jgi:ribulose-phosphate 3-epimerase